MLFMVTNERRGPAFLSGAVDQIEIPRTSWVMGAGFRGDTVWK